MPDFLIFIVGGASYDINIKNFFNSYGLEVIHRDARSSGSLKKQFVNRNTLGVIITVDRSHMAFGDSNEFTRTLKENKVPFVFSSGNLATMNSARMLLQKIRNEFPNLLRVKDPISEKLQKLDTAKSEWKTKNLELWKAIESWHQILYKWESHLNRWHLILNAWKEVLLNWKNIQNSSKYSEFKKKIKKELNYLFSWKEEIHQQGISIQSRINVISEWKNNIEETGNTLISLAEKITEQINPLSNLDSKEAKLAFREWKEKYENIVEMSDLWNKEFNDWEEIIPQTFSQLDQWKKEVDLFSANLNRHFRDFYNQFEL